MSNARTLATLTRPALWTALAIMLQASACTLYHSHSNGHGHASSGCPPGHVWSDGKCHEHGKGHDPNKHAAKWH